MAENKGGSSDPQFYYIERKFFRAIEYSNRPGNWIVVNINSAPISTNELPLSYNGPNGNRVDALGSDQLPVYFSKEYAENVAKKLNDRVITGFEIGFGNTGWNRAKAVFNQNPALQFATGIVLAGFIFSVGFLIHQGITVWWR